MKTVKDIIKRLGGNTAVGRILGVGPSTVSEMARRGTIRVDYWPTLVEAATNTALAEKDKRETFSLTFDDLVAVHVETESVA